MVLDGPFAETKEQLLGFYVVDCDSLEEALDFARDLAKANPGGAYEMRPDRVRRDRWHWRMTDMAWIDAALVSARPQAVGALLRYFRDLDSAEEAFQDACLRALEAWPATARRAIPPLGSSWWAAMRDRCRAPASQEQAVAGR